MKMVGLIHDLLADSEEGMQIEMQLPEVDSDTLGCVWKYLENYRNGEPEKLEKPLKVIVTKPLTQPPHPLLLHPDIF